MKYELMIRCGKRLFSTVAAFALVILAGCGSNNSSDSITSDPEGEPEVSPTYSVAVSWTIPLEREDGEPLSAGDIAGYAITVSNESDSNFRETYIDSGIATDYEFNDIPEGVYEFIIVAIDTNNLRSLDSPAFEVVVNSSN